MNQGQLVHKDQYGNHKDQINPSVRMHTGSTIHPAGLPSQAHCVPSSPEAASQPTEAKPDVSVLRAPR